MIGDGFLFVRQTTAYEVSACLVGSEMCIRGIASPSLQKVWCPTRPFTGLQLSAVVSKYVKEHPEQWSENPQVLVSRALQQAFPCKK